jgi:RimJ/RimL family protein N-acetyltransferase
VWHDLVAFEPTAAEIDAAAGALAAAYSEPHNARMMGHDEPFTAADVVEHYRTMIAEGARPFLLEQSGALMGDADLRGIAGGRAEVALMVAAPSSQGRGLGTRFAIMLHAFAFRTLGLERLYVAIVPGNAASRRLFEKLGYRVDDSPAARVYVDDAGEVSLSVTRADFERAHGAVVPEIQVQPRIGGGAG